MYTVRRVKAIHAVLKARYMTASGHLANPWPEWLTWNIVRVLVAHELVIDTQTTGPQPRIIIK